MDAAAAGAAAARAAARGAEVENFALRAELARVRELAKTREEMHAADQSLLVAEREVSARLRAELAEAEKAKPALRRRSMELEATKEQLTTMAEVSETLKACVRQVEEEKQVAQAERRRLLALDAEEALQTVADVSLREQELRQALESVLSRLAERRVQLEVERRAKHAERGALLCKICFEEEARCALLPCKHHAFCRACATRILDQQKPTCPLCRAPATEIFETFSS